MHNPLLSTAPLPAFAAIRPEHLTPALDVLLPEADRRGRIDPGALDRLEAFASFNGPDWYGLPRNTSRITLLRAPKDDVSKLQQAVEALGAEPMRASGAGKRPAASSTFFSL